MKDNNTIDNPLILKCIGEKFTLNKRLVVEDEITLELVDKELLIDAKEEISNLKQLFGHASDIGFAKFLYKNGLLKLDNSIDLQSQYIKYLGQL